MKLSTDSILTQAPRVAEVAYLPTAAGVPVRNPKRRGRLPKGVVAIGVKQAVAQAAQITPEPMDPLIAAHRMLDLVQCALDVTRKRLAEYEKGQRRTG